MAPSETKRSRMAARVSDFVDYLTTFNQPTSGSIQLIPLDHRHRAIRSGSNLFPRPFIRSSFWLFASCLLSIGLVFTRDLFDAFSAGWSAELFFDEFFLIRGILAVSGVGIYMLWFLYLEEKLCNYEARIQHTRIQRLSNEKQMLESRLKLLKAQVEPHFLFNTLTSIVSLDDTDPEKAKAMHIDFMLYLDETFNKMRSDQTTVGQEIKMIRAYLDIFKIRMGSRLTYRINVPDYLQDIVFPPMLIQPVVENAIRHGLEPQVTGGRIFISAAITGKQLSWEIADTGVGISDNADLGIGLGNVMDRLESLFGPEADLRVEENQPTGTKVIIEVPYA